MSPFRARSSTRPEKFRGIRSEILPTAQESQYYCCLFNLLMIRMTLSRAQAPPRFWMSEYVDGQSGL
jgi:hypothetical protein